MSDTQPRIAADLAEALAIAIRDLGRIAERIDSASRRLEGAANSLEVYGAAALLNGYYSHLERVFERIVRDMNSAPPEGPDWHRRLLRSVTIERQGVRPAVLGVELAEQLEELLAFRHLFRNLYVLDLRAGRVADLLRLTSNLHVQVVQSLDNFRQFVERLSNITD